MPATALLDIARKYLTDDRLAFVESALEFATASHDGQLRKSGDPFIEHPLATSEYLAAMGMDATTLAAGLLHDVMEDCGIEYAELESRFGSEVAGLVESVTKLNQLDLIPRGVDGSIAIVPVEQAGEDGDAALAAARAASMRKMFVAMARDVRVVLIKLADRLHNMLTLHALPPHRQVAIARETLDIYAPLAHRLGVWDVKWRLEDESFKYLYPREYRAISRLLARRRAERDSYVRRACDALRTALDDVGVAAQVSGRAKHIYSIYQKTKRYEEQGRKLEDIHDLIALRVIVETEADCYAALGTVHATWPPVPSQFDDYIASPKDNMYQSLHTVVRCLDAYPVEVQIRTGRMHELAEHGVAAHAAYKEGSTERDLFEERMSWVKRLLDTQRETHGDFDYVESVKTDILQDQVFVYTPVGDVIEMPAGATPLDFAYRVHTEVGHSCVGAIVNGKLTALNTPLSNGDTVRIRKSKQPRGPKLDWLNPDLGFLKTAGAREKVGQWFRRQERAVKRERGREFLRRQLRQLHPGKDDAELARLMNFESAEELYEAIGTGQIQVAAIAERLAPTPEAEPPTPAPVSTPGQVSAPGIVVLGMEGLLTRFGRCCSPVYGEEIVGYVTRNRGVTVHRATCPSIRDEDEPERLVEVAWGHSDSRYPVPLRIDAWDRVGLIRDITSVVSGESVNIHSLTSTESPIDARCTITLTVYTTGIEQLSRLFAKLETVRGVNIVARHRLGDGQAAYGAPSSALTTSKSS